LDPVLEYLIDYCYEEQLSQDREEKAQIERHVHSKVLGGFVLLTALPTGAIQNKRPPQAQ
jgi:hypothetical protein